MDRRQPAEPTRDIRYNLARSNGLYHAQSTGDVTWFWREGYKRYYIRPDGLVVISEVS